VACHCLAVVAVHHGDEVDADVLRTRRLTLAVVGARPEVLLHGLDHRLDALPALVLAAEIDLGQPVGFHQGDQFTELIEIERLVAGRFFCCSLFWGHG